MTNTSLTNADVIAAARMPTAHGLYFVGLFTPRITFFSQQVRALRSMLYSRAILTDLHHTIGFSCQFYAEVNAATSFSAMLRFRSLWRR